MREAAERATGGGSVARVAILEQRRLMRESVAAVLTQSGLQIAGTASRTAELFDVLARSQPQVAILDLDEANGTAADLVREVVQKYPDTRVLAISSGRSADEVQRFMKEGAAGFLDTDSASCDALVQATWTLLRGPDDTSGNKKDPLSRLTQREKQVLSYLSGGADNLKIAALLRISERTVKAHVAALYQKLGSENRVQLALLARELGVRPLTE